jgi:hypothetical protein
MDRRTFLASPLAAAVAASASAPSAVDLGTRRELFVDRYLIDRLEGASLRLQRPVEREAVLAFDRPWEGAFSGYVTVIRAGGDFHLYYRGVSGSGPDGREAETTCYAHSRNGIHWTRPSLRLFEVAGTRDNNVILAHEPPFSHNFSPFLDRRPGVPEGERFKALAGTKKTGLVGFISADGVHWRKLRPEPLLPPTTGQAYDSQNVAFWSEAEGRYLCYYRTLKDRVRWISRAVSEDFRRWEPGREMSFGEAPAEHLYTNQTSPYFRAPHLYVAIAARFMPGRQVVSEAEAGAIGVHPEYFKDCSDGVLLTSRGGERYDREFLESFLRPGPGLSNWVSRDNYPALNVVETGEAEMSFYVNRHYGQPTAHLSRYSLRLDGFAALTAPYRGGEMVTRPVRFTGSRLELNYATSAPGSIRVEIQDRAGTPLTGFALADCRELIGDRIARDVEWHGKNLGALTGRPVRLRFALRDAEVYSLRFKA